MPKKYFSPEHIGGWLQPVTVNYTSSENNVNVYSDAGSPSSGTAYLVTINVDDGVIIGSANTATHAMNLGGPWHADTILKLVNNGRIQGAGGAGGAGGSDTTSGDTSGGGGGGAGTVAGTGGSSQGSASNGAAGTSTAGGNGGGGGEGAVSNTAGSAGSDGGPALKIDADTTVEAVYIDNTNGEIWGGGGGGGGGDNLGAGAGGNGGNPGEAGQQAAQNDHEGGAAGKAIQKGAVNLIWLGGNSSPNLKGTVS